MTRPIKVLILEDVESDAELMVHELKRAGFQPDWMRVDTENQYLSALGSGPDLILADYNLLQFDAFQALLLMQELKLDIPFIVISGAITEDIAVEFMKQGASDYLLKDRLSRLGQAAAKALEQRELQEEKGRTEEALRREYERRKDLEEIINHSPVIVFLWRNEPGWPVEMVSENIKIFGYSADDFLSQIIHYADIIHPDDLGRIENEVGQHTAQRDREFVQYYRIITKDGQIRWVDDRTTLRLSPSGEITHYQGTILDITSRVQAEEALRNEKEFANGLINTAQALILVLDAQGRIAMINPHMEEITGYRLEEIRGKDWFEIFLPESDRQGIRELFSRAISGTSTKGNINSIVAKDGREIVVEWHDKTLRDPSGKVTGLLSIGQDITEHKKTEERLRTSNQILDGILNSIPARVFWKDSNLVFLGCNAIFAHDAGFANSKDIVGKDDYQMVWRDQAELYRADDRQVIESGCPKLLIEEPQTTPDGNTIVLLTSKIPLRGSEEEIIGVLGTYMDITERKRAEEKLKRSEEKYRTIFEDAAVGIFQTSVQGRLLGANPALANMFGFASAEEMMANVTDLSAQLYSRSEDREHLTRRLAEHDAVDNFEAQGHKRDGRSIWVSINVHTIRDHDGAILHLEGTCIDITERRQAEEALQESEARHRTILQTAMEGFWLADMQGRLLEVNDAYCRMSGYSAQELLAMRISDLEAGETADEVIAHIQDLIVQGEDRFETRHRRKDGSIFPVEVSVQCRTSEDGMTVAFLRDITERKRMEEALAKRSKDLARSNADLAQFAYVASHDLQEPLRMVTSYVQLLEKRYKGKLDPDADEFIGYIVEGTKRMKLLLKALLDYSRVGRRGNPRQTVECETVLETALQNLKVVLEETGGTVTHDPLPEIIADELQMVQLFQNLISNGLKFHGPQPPLIHVSAKQEGTNWIFSFHDKGIGIDPQYFEKIFVVFQRLHTRDKYPGMGIGLAIAKKIVERHGGRIWVESEKDKGSAFYFTIPVEGIEEGRDI